MSQQGPILRPNEVKGFLGHTQANPPDRLFYVLEETSKYDALWEVDGYCMKTPEGRELWTLHIVCPKCGNNLAIKSLAKDIRVTPAGVEVEEFKCTWPGDFGSAICGYAGALELPPKDKRETRDQHGVRRRVDAVLKRA